MVFQLSIRNSFGGLQVYAQAEKMNFTVQTPSVLSVTYIVTGLIIAEILVMNLVTWLAVYLKNREFFDKHRM